MRLKTFKFIALISVLLFSIACGAIQTTPTPVPTPIPTPTPTPVPPTPTPKTFVIQDEAFEAEYEEHKTYCDVDAQVQSAGDELYLVVGGEMWIPIRGTSWVLWCYGAKHTWIGELTYAGHTFASDDGDPLQFLIDEHKGYVYVAGKGTVTLPDGTSVTLP